MTAANMLKAGAQFLADQMAANASETVTYSRPGGASAPGVAAVVGQTVFRVQDTRVFRLDWEGTDFIIKRADLAAVIGTGDPQKHDRITLADGSIYEVEPTNGEPCWRKSDQHGVRLRIHAKKAN